MANNSTETTTDCDLVEREAVPRRGIRNPLGEDSDSESINSGLQFEALSDEPPSAEESASGGHCVDHHSESPSLELRGRSRCVLRQEPAAGNEPGSAALRVPRRSERSLGRQPQAQSCDSWSDELSVSSSEDDVFYVAPEHPQTTPPMPLDLMTEPVCSTFSESQINRAARCLRSIKTAHNLAAAQGKTLDVEATVREAAAFQESYFRNSGGGNSSEDSETSPPGRPEEFRAGDDTSVALGDSSDERANEDTSMSPSCRPWLPWNFCRIRRHPRCIYGARFLFCALSMGGMILFSLALLAWVVWKRTEDNAIPTIPPYEPTAWSSGDDFDYGGRSPPATSL